MRAVDTGLIHGPAQSRNAAGRAFMAEAKTMHDEALCAAVLITVHGDGADLASIAARMYVQEMADRLRDYRRAHASA